MAGEYNDRDDLLLNDARSVSSQGCCSSFCNKHRWIKYICLGFLGLILLALSVQGFFLPQLINEIMRQTLKDSLIFTYPKPNDSAYKAFLSNTGKNGVPIWMEMRFFNVTNEDGILKYGEFPQVEMSPPIVYNQWQQKSNVNYSDNGEWVEFDSITYYTFNPDRSEINESDYYVVVSPLIPFLYQAHETASIEDQFILDQVFKWLENNTEHVFLRGTAKQLLFDAIRINYTFHHPKGFDYTFEFELPGGLLTNQTTPENETIHTGYGDHTRIGEVKQWKGSEYLTCWNPALELSPGHDDFFGLWTIEKGGTILAWVDDLFINLIGEYEDIEHFYGVELYRYSVQIDPQFLNATEWPPNAQYNAFGPSGILNLSACSAGIPFFVSLPYFLGGPEYAKNLSLMGLHNISWSDQPFFSVEPITGVIFHANKSLQINTQLKPVPEEWIKDKLDYTSDTSSDTSDTSESSVATDATVTDEIDIGRRDRRHENTTSSPTPNPTSVAPTPSPTTAVPTPGPTALPTTLSPTLSPTTGPTKAKKSLTNLPYIMVPIIETSECEAFPKDQCEEFKTEVYGTQNLIKILEIVGYVSLPIFIIYTWWLCFYIGKRRARIRKL